MEIRTETDLVSIYIEHNGIDDFLTIWPQVISQRIPELFNLYVPTLVLIKVCKSFAQVFIISNLLQMNRNSNEFSIVQSTVPINVSLPLPKWKIQCHLTKQSHQENV